MLRAVGGFLLLVSVAVAADADAEAELKALEGRWVIDRARLAGRDHLDDFAGMKLTIKGNEYLIEFAENSDRGTFTVDPAKSPKWIDIQTAKKGPFFGRTLHGIYKIEKEKLILCCEADGKARPTAFEAPEKGRNMLLTYQREKK
jgi:uncharacterized protein (TIGR03067 family)